MSVDAVYRGIRIYNVIDETTEDANIGPRLEYPSGKIERVDWGDPDLVIDPTDEEWNAAEEEPGT